MRRFFLNGIISETMELTGTDAHHIARVLRMAVGDNVIIADENERTAKAEITAITDEVVTLSLIEYLEDDSEPTVKVRLAQCLPKSDKMEFIIQKAVELGAHTITPFDSEFCVRRPDADKVRARLPRWNKIATEAAKQCGRSYIPAVTEPLSYPEMLDAAGECQLVLFCYEADGAHSLKTVLTHMGGVSSVAVIVGAEGGFSPKEAAAAAARGFHLVNLGPRILRCETAPLYALSALSYFYEL
jgi:16S rRNA (uracil1498-N3)-methyltransferase